MQISKCDSYLQVIFKQGFVSVNPLSKGFPSVAFNVAWHLFVCK